MPRTMTSMAFGSSLRNLPTRRFFRKGQATRRSGENARKRKDRARRQQEKEEPEREADAAA